MTQVTLSKIVLKPIFKILKFKIYYPITFILNYFRRADFSIAGGGMNPAPPLSRFLLDRMMRLAEEQAKRKKNGHRFKDDVLLRFAMNVRLFSGRRAYEILHSNLGKGVFPAPSTIEKKTGRLPHSSEGR